MQIAEKNKAKQKGNSSLNSFMKYININAAKSKEEGFTIAIGKYITRESCLDVFSGVGDKMYSELWHLYLQPQKSFRV